MSKNAKKILFLSAATIAGMYAYNKFVESTTNKLNMMKIENGEYFEWSQGKVFYTKSGTGSPVLLVHDISAASSGEEWSKIYKRLNKTHTVYTIDLLGCGRSDKPGIEYTTYLYVQLLTAFCQKVIKEKTDIVASNMAAAPVIMASKINQELFERIILINPVSIKKLNQSPDKFLKVQKNIMQLPIVGTFIYNILHTPAKMDIIFKTKYYLKPQLISSKTRETYYESAHLDGSKGKYLFSSLLANYMNTDIKHAIKTNKKPISIIGCRELRNNIESMDQYHKLNSNIEITHISNGNLYPQLEIPEKIVHILENKLK